MTPALLPLAGPGFAPHATTGIRGTDARQGGRGPHVSAVAHSPRNQLEQRASCHWPKQVLAHRTLYGWQRHQRGAGLQDRVAAPVPGEPGKVSYQASPVCGLGHLTPPLRNAAGTSVGL